VRAVTSASEGVYSNDVLYANLGGDPLYSNIAEVRNFILEIMSPGVWAGPSPPPVSLYPVYAPWGSAWRFVIFFVVGSGPLVWFFCWCPVNFFDSALLSFLSFS